MLDNVRIAAVAVDTQPENLIGNLKKILDRFSRRGLNAALGELQLAATAHNLLKIYRAGTA